MTHMLPPSEIRFIQDSVRAEFSNGNDMLEVFEDLCRGRLRPEQMGPIEVVKYQGLNFAFDGNRRLLLFKVCAVEFHVKFCTGLVHKIDETII